MTEFSPERAAYRESWVKKIQGYVAGKALQALELLAPEYDADNRCTECEAHISEPHDPRCSRSDVELDDEADAAEWRAS